MTAFVTLIYFLFPPTLFAQLLQVLCWFGAVVFLMIGYLWNLPWRLSGEHAALWAIRELRHKPINQWESIDGYSVLQTAVATAAARADLGTVRSITIKSSSGAIINRGLPTSLALYDSLLRYSCVFTSVVGTN